MGYIFVSYSRKQMYFAEAVSLHLQQAGFEVWFDLQKLGPGVDWAPTLKDGYSNCEKLVLIASKAAIASRYVQVEWETALQNGREVIVILTEAVTLPESLRTCQTYDARTHFDRIIHRLIANLRGEQPPRYDPIPAPGWFPLPLTMPLHVSFTLLVLALPALSVWFAAAIYPVEWSVYALGLAVGVFLLIRHGIAGFRFWAHRIRFEEIKGERWNLLLTQAATSILCWLLLFLSPEANPFIRLMSVLILLLPLVTVYWGFRLLERSADILRWFPSGDADQDLREALHSKLIGSQQGTSADGLPITATGVAFALHCHPADRALGERVKSVFQKEGCQPVDENRANTHLIILTNRTSKQWLLERNNTLSGRAIYILATNIDTSPELQPILQKQVVDFRMGRVKTIQAMAARLANESGEQASYGMQVSPKGFSNFYSLPLAVWVVWWAFALSASILILWGLREMSQGGLILAVLGIAVWLCFDLLMVRKLSLPEFFHKLTGNRLAWFASPAPVVKDPVGMDKKSRMRLMRWAFLPLVVFLLADMFQPPAPPDPIENYSLEFEIDGSLYRKAGDTTYIMIDGTPMPFIVDGTRVATLEP